MIGKALAFFVDIFRIHKLKLFSFILAVLVFSFLMFPYDDLSEVVSTIVSERTNNQVFLQFDRLGFQIIPFPALAVDNVVVESSFLPSIQAGHLSLAPSIAGFLSFRPGFNAGIREVWKGDIDVELKTGKKNDQGVAQQLIKLDLDKIDLAKVNETLDFPLKIQGALSGDSNVVLDPSFQNQPDGEIMLRIKELRFPAGTIPISGFGPLALPGLSWSNIVVKGKLSQGKLQITQGELGSSSDLINGMIRGEMDLRLEPREGGQVGFSLGAYLLNVDLNIDNKLGKDAALGLVQGFLGNFKTATTSGARYRFKVTGQRFGLAPSLSAASL